jgi:hypothetical protein
MADANADVSELLREADELRRRASQLRDTDPDEGMRLLELATVLIGEAHQLALDQLERSPDASAPPEPEGEDRSSV